MTSESHVDRHTEPDRPETPPLRRRVFHRYWWTLGWSNEHRPGPHVTWNLCFSNFNRLIVRWELRDPDARWFVIEWGNGNSDPAWSIGWQS